MPRNPVVRYTGYLRKLLKDDETRIELGDVLRAYMRSRYLNDCAEKILKKVFRVDDVLVGPVDKKNIRVLAQRLRSPHRRTRKLIISSIAYETARSFIGPLERRYMAVILDKAIVLIPYEKVDPEWGDPMYFIKDKYEVIQA